MASRKVPISPDDYESYLRELRLRSIRLKSLSSAREAEDSGDEKLAFDAGWTGCCQEQDDSLRFVATHTVKMRSGEVVLATIEVEHEVLLLKTAKMPKGFDEVFITNNLDRMVYPFVREVVAGLSSKMDLPLLTLPFHLFRGAPKAKQKAKEG